MNSRERVQTALRLEEPDRVPYCELGIDRALARKLLQWDESGNQAASLESNTYTVDEAKVLASFLQKDNICYVLRAPVYAHKESGKDGRLFYGEGMLKTREDLRIVQLPDPCDESLYAEAEAFLEQKGDYSTWLVTRFGIFPTMLSMGLQNFSLALYDDLAFVEDLLDRYCDWAIEVAKRVCGMGFDVFVTTDDIAYKTSPFFSPEVFKELMLPRYRRLVEVLSLPWIFHSDGNMLPFLNDLVELGVSGLHPIEDGAMDIRVVKRAYGDRICLLGNVNLNLLGLGTPETVDREVRGLIWDVGSRGGYMVTSGNSLAGYLKPENVVAMSKAVQKYGVYPLK
jgi:hypothetical protein